MLQIYETRDDLMNELADRVAAELKTAIAANGKASLAVPGGTTPAPFLQALSEIDLTWNKVSVLMGDERIVEETSERSNTRLLKQNFLINEAAHAHFIRYITNDKDPEAIIKNAIDSVNTVLPLDVLVVGMGEDMHTASLFPDSPDINTALSDKSPTLVMIHADNAGEPRISLSANALRNARKKHVLITGEAKRKAFEKALKTPSENIAPIRVVLNGENPAIVHYAP